MTNAEKYRLVMLVCTDTGCASSDALDALLENGADPLLAANQIRAQQLTQINLAASWASAPVQLSPFEVLRIFGLLEAVERELATWPKQPAIAEPPSCWRNHDRIRLYVRHKGAAVAVTDDGLTVTRVCGPDCSCSCHGHYGLISCDRLHVNPG